MIEELRLLYKILNSLDNNIDRFVGRQVSILAGLATIRGGNTLMFINNGLITGWI